eukprot:6483489-Amphidinium_carterae.2
MMRGSPCPEAIKFREQALALFMSGPSSSLLNNVLMKKVPNGDWRILGEVQFFVPMDKPLPCEEDISLMLATTLAYIFLRSKPSVFARHRWTGIDIALDELGRLQCCHGLLSSTYARFLSSFRAGTGQARGEGQAVVGDIAGTRHLSRDHKVADAMSHDSHGDDVLIESVLEASTTQVAQDMVMEEKKSAEVHALDRRKAQTWLMQEPFADLVLCRVAVEPLMTLMGSLLVSSGEAWEVEQRGHALKQLEGKVETPRLFNVTVAADMVLESEFFENLARSYTTASWFLVPQASRTTKVNSRAFRMLSRQGCMVQQQLVHLHSRFPYRMFKLISRSTTPQDILAVPPCVLDPWSMALITQFPTLTGAAFEATLHAHALVASTTVAGIESRHSSIRRHLVTRSVQTHPLPAHSLSAQWVLQNQRSALQQHAKYMDGKPSRVGSRALQQVPEDNMNVTTIPFQESCGSLMGKDYFLLYCSQIHLATPCLQAIAPKTRHGAGGVWRAWVRYHSLGVSGRPSLGELAKQYRDAKAADAPLLGELKRLAAAATLAAKHKQRKSSSAFGLRGKDAKLARLRAAQKSLWQRCRGKSKQAKSQLLAATSSWDKALPDPVSAAKAVRYMDGLCKRKESENVLRELRRYAQDSGATAARALKSGLPSLPFSADNIIPVPGPIGNTFHWTCSPLRGPTEAAGFASRSGATNLSTQLGSEWLCDHEPIMPAQCEVPTYAPPPTLCCASGICVHAGKGKRAWSLGRALIAQMRTMFASGENRAKLSSGMIIADFRRSSCCLHHSETQLDLFMHLGHMSFSPYRPTCHIMNKLNHHPFSAEYLPGIIVLQTFIEACLSLCPDCTWSVVWYELEENRRELPEMSPLYVTCNVLEGTSSDGTPFWPSKRGSTRPHKRAKMSGARHTGYASASTKRPERDFQSMADSNMPFAQTAHDDASDDSLRLRRRTTTIWTFQMRGLSPRTWPCYCELKGHSLQSVDRNTTGGSASTDALDSTAPPTCMAAVPVHAQEVESRQRSTAAATHMSANGRISFHFSKNSFEAVCSVLEPYGSCNISRTCKGRMRGGVETRNGGRPLGFLSYWLSVAQD